MQVLQTLGVALGLASLAGLNLYLTVFVTGLAIQQHWIDVSQTYPELAILAHPAILIVSGVLYLLQFFADKVPWVDSLWDAVHTFIRPIGGAFLALRVLGTLDPAIEVVAALLAGGVTFTTHSMKAGTRLVANHSPEPFSNIALSLGEDAAVVGGLFLIKQDPILALIVFSLLLLAIGYVGPKIFRGAKVQLWLIWKKIASPAVGQTRDRVVEGPAARTRHRLLQRQSRARSHRLGGAVRQHFGARSAGQSLRLPRGHRRVPDQSWPSLRSAAGNTPPRNSISPATRSPTSRNS